MAKARVAKGTSSSANRPANSRVQFLYQAAILLAEQHSKLLPITSPIVTSDVLANTTLPHSLQPLSRNLVSDLRSVSRKTQIRLSPAIKQSMCKSCNTILVEGSTCMKEMENRSKDGEKPWADVLVQKCNTCGLAKRFPVGAQRQKRRPRREDKGPVEEKSGVAQEDIQEG